MAVAAEIKRRRIKRRMTQEELADLAEIPRPTFTKLERGLTSIDMEQLERVARALGVQPDGLVRHARQSMDNADADTEVEIEPDRAIRPPTSETVTAVISRSSEFE